MCKLDNESGTRLSGLQANVKSRHNRPSARFQNRTDFRVNPEPINSESDLRRAEERFRLVVESSPAAMVIVDHSGRIVLVNRKTETWFGYDRAELIGQEVEVLIPERFHDRHRHDRDGYLRSPQSRPMGAGHDLFARRKDGSEFPVDISLHPMKTEDGPLVMAHIVDLTELRQFAALQQAQAEIRKRDEQIQFMIDHLPAGAAYVDVRSRELQVNATLCQITGYSADEFPHVDSWFRNVSGQFAEEQRALYESDRASEFSKTRTQTIRTKDGRTIDAEISRYHYDEHEVWLIQDVTERLRMQNELRQQRDFLERILETAQVIILVLDPQGNIVRFNQFMRDLSGYELEDVLGQSWFETFLPAGDSLSIQELFARVADGEEVREHVNAIRTRDGEERQIAWWGKALRDTDGIVTEVLSVGHDVTDLRNIQDKLVQSERLAAIGQMIAGLAHESRNALQRARACLDMLSLDLEEQPRQLELTGRVLFALDELQRLYEEVRNYAAPVKLSLGRHDLADIWRTAWQHVIQTQDAPSVSLREDVGSIDTTAVCDRHRLEQVFRNILENAVAVAPAGSEVTLRCCDCQIEGRPATCMAVSDEGPGLTPEESERIFEPFFTTKQKGTGLGMAISERIIDAHGGSIRAGSGPRGGATIEVRLPKLQSHRPAVKSREPVANTRNLTGPK